MRHERFNSLGVMQIGQKKHLIYIGILIKYDESSIIWISKLQTISAMSTTEAEFSALTICVREVLWARNVLMDIGYSERYETTILQDNLGSIS